MSHMSPSDLSATSRLAKGHAYRELQGNAISFGDGGLESGGKGKGFFWVLVIYFWFPCLFHFVSMFAELCVPRLAEVSQIDI